MLFPHEVHRLCKASCRERSECVWGRCVLFTVPQFAEDWLQTSRLLLPKPNQKPVFSSFLQFCDFQIQGKSKAEVIRGCRIYNDA